MAIEVARGSGSSMPEVPAEFVARCTAYPWPGNLAELRSCVASAFRLATGGKLSLAPIPKPSEPAAMATIVPYRAAVREFDRRVFSEALAATEGNVPRAARLLRLPESTFRYRAGKLELLGRTGTPEVSGAAPQAVSPPESESRA
jgi:arginine utilization regulatory protein